MIHNAKNVKILQSYVLNVGIIIIDKFMIVCVFNHFLIIIRIIWVKVFVFNVKIYAKIVIMNMIIVQNVGIMILIE